MQNGRGASRTLSTSFTLCLSILGLNTNLKLITPLSDLGHEEGVTEVPNIPSNDFAPKFNIPKHLSRPPPNPQLNISREGFIERALAIENPPFNRSAIHRLCSQEPAWEDDLVFECTPAMGGLNNDRQQILTCVRWAIEFRAAIILPTIRPRLSTNTSKSVVHQYSDPGKIEYLFDKDRFLDRLEKGCPQMRIYENREMVERIGQVKSVKMVELKRGSTKEQVEAYKGRWRSRNKSERGKVRLVQVKKMATE